MYNNVKFVLFCLIVASGFLLPKALQGQDQAYVLFAKEAYLVKKNGAQTPLRPDSLVPNFSSDYVGIQVKKRGYLGLAFSTGGYLWLSEQGYYTLNKLKPQGEESTALYLLYATEARKDSLSFQHYLKKVKREPTAQNSSSSPLPFLHASEVLLSIRCPIHKKHLTDCPRLSVLSEQDTLHLENEDYHEIDFSLLWRKNPMTSIYLVTENCEENGASQGSTILLHIYQEEKEKELLRTLAKYKTKKRKQYHLSPMDRMARAVAFEFHHCYLNALHELLKTSEQLGEEACKKYVEEFKQRTGWK